MTASAEKVAAVGERLVELLDVQDGWKDGKGLKPRQECFPAAERIALALVEEIGEGEEVPRIFPTPAGGLTVEARGVSVWIDAEDVEDPVKRERIEPVKAGEAEVARPLVERVVRVTFFGVSAVASETLAGDDEGAAIAFAVRGFQAAEARRRARAERDAAAALLEASRRAATVDAAAPEPGPV